MFDYRLEDGQAPVPAPIKTVNGKSNELKLMQQYEKNRQRQQQAPAKPPASRPEDKKPAQEVQESF